VFCKDASHNIGLWLPFSLAVCTDFVQPELMKECDGNEPENRKTKAVCQVLLWLSLPAGITSSVLLCSGCAIPQNAILVTTVGSLCFIED